MKVKVLVVAVALGCLLVPLSSHAGDLKAGEKTVYTQMQSYIPGDKKKTVDDLHAKWQEVQAGKSDAKIIDIRTESEFNAGHIMNSNNVDSGHAYGMVKKITDPNQEIWVFCRTQHRATYFASLLYQFGYTNVYFVEGGIKAWADKGYPLCNKYLGEIKVNKYEKKLKEDFWYRENH